MDTGRDEEEPAMLNMLAEKIMSQPMKPQHMAYCPTMDLIALVTVDEQVQVHRLNGQRVFGVSNRKRDCRVVQMTWKPNGQLLAVGFSDSSISLISAQTGKSVHRIQCSTYSESPILFLGWGLNFTDVEGIRQHIARLEANFSLDDIVSRGLQAHVLDFPADLPSDLAFLDTEGVLPRLSTLPISGKEDELFSTRASLDAIFHATRKDSNESADVLLVGFEDGTLHLSIFDFFRIGIFDTKQLFQGRPNSKVMLQSNHPYSSTHGLLILTPALNQEELYFVPLDLRLIPETGKYLSLLASKSTQLYNVLLYLKEVQLEMYNEFKTSQDLPSKFIRNIEEELQEKEQSSFVNAAYQLVATGNCSSAVKEWLVDQLGERGHKRWDKAAVTGYENVRRLTHENLLPALERFSVLTSRLRGLSRSQGTSTLGLATRELDNILDTVNCLHLLSHSILITAGIELRQFLAFSSWMRQEIEIQGMDPTSMTSEEGTEKDTMLDYAQILEYIEGPLLQSRLVELFGVQASPSNREEWEMADVESLIYDSYKRDLNALQALAPSEKKLPGLDKLITRLEDQCKVVFDRIAETQKRKVRFGEPVLFGTGTVKCAAMRMLVDMDATPIEACTTYIATTMTGEEQDVQVHKIDLKILNGISSTYTISHASIALPPKTNIQDLKFVDDTTLLLATINSSSSHIFYIPYRSTASQPSPLNFVPKVGTTSGDNILDLTNESVMAAHTRHTFAPSPSTAPRCVEVNGRKGRRVVCVMAQDLVHYRIFDLDTPREG